MKNKLFISIMLAVIVFGIQWILRAGSNNGKIEVKVEALGLNTFDEDLVFQGIIFPKNVVPIYTDTSTVIKSILVKEGSEVKKGENLFEFSHTVRNDLKRELDIVELDIKGRRLQLSDIRSGSMKLELEERELERASLKEEINSLNRDIDLVSFEALTLNKQANVMNELLEKKGVSSVEANASKALADRKKNELEDLKTNLSLSKQRYDLSVLSYQRLRRELLLNENNINGEYQKLLLQKTNLERKLIEITQPLKAPYNGIITEIVVNEGESVPQGAKLLSISSGKEFLVKLEVPLHQSKWVKLGQSAKILTRGDFENKSYIGEVHEIAKIAKIKNEQRVIEIEIIVLDSEGMKPGYLTDIELKGFYQTGVITVDSFSVVEEDGISYVYVLDGEVVNKVEVDLGIKTSSKYEILNLPLGTEIVINPFKVKDGQKIIVVR